VAVRDAAGRTIVELERRAARAGVVTSLDIELPVQQLGSYELAMQVREGTRLATTSGRFEVGLADLAGLGGGADGTALLRFLLAASEVDSLMRAPGAERERLWQEFWRRRDPDPATPENEARDVMLGRIRYANAHFSAAEPGWRTARGRVYLKLGSPDRIDALENPNAFDRIERWTYLDGDKVFVFVDRTGRGDFELQRTNAEGF
jgi:GWxTD domain-containing protein